MNQVREEAAVVSGSEDNASAVDLTNNFETLSVSSSSSSSQSAFDDKHDDEDNDDEPFYDSNLDDEDEDFVHRFMRGLQEENHDEKPISKKERSTNGEPVNKKSGVASSLPPSPSDVTQMHNNKPLKPRDSDAILSCPCCFTTVCMDCQQHEKYTDQYRAMFVMSIGVDWRRKMIFNEKSSTLEEAVGSVVENNGNEDNGNKSSETFYYPVFCSNCGTEVAALNMEDEVYHFYGCIASG